MSGFSQVRLDNRKPPRIIVFPPTIFSDTWKSRPTADVAIGIRVPGDYDVSCARANAARIAWDLHPLEADVSGRMDAMNDAIMREFCSLGMCSANDVYQAYFPDQEDDVRMKLTTEGAKRIFDEVEQLQIETSPVHREADDDECVLLAGALTVASETIDALPAFKAKRIRRLVAFLHDELLLNEE